MDWVACEDNTCRPAPHWVADIHSACRPTDSGSRIINLVFGLTIDELTLDTLYPSVQSQSHPEPVSTGLKFELRSQLKINGNIRKTYRFQTYPHFTPQEPFEHCASPRSP